MAKNAIAKIWNLLLRSDGSRYSKPPISPPTLSAVVNSTTQITVTASGAASGLGSISGYLWYRNGSLISSTPSASPLVDTGLAPSTAYVYSALAVDSASNRSALSATATATTNASGDTTAPTVPSGVAASTINATTLRIVWLPSTDATGVTEYRIERSNDGATGWAQIGTATTPTYDDATLTQNTRRYYRVKAADAANNVSAASAVVTAVTSASGTGTGAPTQPVLPEILAVGPTSISFATMGSSPGAALIWKYETWGRIGSAAFAKLCESAYPIANVTGLVSNTTYDLKMMAVDEDGVASAFSDTITATTDFAVSARMDCPVMPTSVPHTKYVTPTGNVWTATQTASNAANNPGTGTGNRTGCGLQYALTNAALGDLIELPAGAVFDYFIDPPNKTGSGYVYVQTSGYASLPVPGGRATRDTHLPAVATIKGVFSRTHAMQLKNGAHHYRFVGVDFLADQAGGMYNLVQHGLGNGADTSLASLPNNIIYDRCLFRGNPVHGTVRGLFGDGAFISLLGCSFYDFIMAGQDTQAVLLINGSGGAACKAVNCYFEGAGENIMAGGGDPSIPNARPSDWWFIDCTFFKPLTWRNKPMTASYGTFPSGNAVIKNLFEYKNARRFYMARCNFENNWAGNGQAGPSVLVTPRNQNGTAPWSGTEDLFHCDFKITSHSGINVMGSDDGGGGAGFTSEQTKRVWFHNGFITSNGMDNTGALGGGARCLQVLRDANGLRLSHVSTYTPNGGAASVYMIAYMQQCPRLELLNNMFSAADYQLWGDSATSLAANIASYDISSNVFVWAGGQGNIPTGANNTIVSANSGVGFTNAGSGDLSLTPSSPFKGQARSYQGVVNGKDIGCNFARLPA